MGWLLFPSISQRYLTHKMALESTDLLVVQKQSGAKEIRKASLSQLSDYLQAEPGVVYKGLANFTDGVKSRHQKYGRPLHQQRTW